MRYIIPEKRGIELKLSKYFYTEHSFHKEYPQVDFSSSLALISHKTDRLISVVNVCLPIGDIVLHIALNDRKEKGIWFKLSSFMYEDILQHVS